MIAQRDSDFPVWGYAPAGTEVTVTLGNESHSEASGRDGRWQVDFTPREAGGPHSMAISDGETTINVSDIWFGDVWVASGQSNMAWIVANSNDAEAEIAAADDPMIRQFKVPLSYSDTPENELAGGDWQIADPDHVANFSAVGYYFARELRKHVDVPIGILNTSWGGSRVEAWMSVETLGEDVVRNFREQERINQEELIARLTEKMGDLPETDAGLVDGLAHWADPALDTSDWLNINAPGEWEQQGLDGYDGIAWYRLSLELSDSEIADSDVILGLGRIDDADISWVNGVEVGRTNTAWNNPREYVVPAGVLHSGTNVIAVRAEDRGGLGGIRGDASELWLETYSGKKSLEGTWQFKAGAFRSGSTTPPNQSPTLLYNKMIHPILPYPMTGYIWYQGESNAFNEGDPTAYADQFKSMISSWRELFGAPDAAFLWVQLANFRQAHDEPTESLWAVLRESQSAALELDKAGEAVIIDIGEANDIHPRNKQDVGLRLSLAARYFTYGEELEYSGPVYASHTIDGSSIVIEYDHAGSGLEARGGELGGFAIAGADGIYHWADARIDGTSVTVSSTDVASPVSVRYAWADNPDRANLYNGAGLPASPFRTDTD